MARKQRVSKRQRRLSELDRPGMTVLFQPGKGRFSGKGKDRKQVGFSTQLLVSAPFAVVMDGRLLVRLVQLRLGEHFTESLKAQVSPDDGRALPRPKKTRRKKNGLLGIQTGKMLRSWQMGKVTGKVSSGRGIIQPYADGASGNMLYSRRFFLEYMLGTRTYTVTDAKYQQRDARGRFVSGGARKGPGPRFKGSPIDFQAVSGRAADVIKSAIDEYINDSGLKTAGPLLPKPKFLGAGNINQVRDASGL